MKILTLLNVILLIILTSACSSTNTVTVEKKPLVSEHALMLSLLNRAVTQDQQMMLTFAQLRAETQPHGYSNAVEIKGPKHYESLSYTYRAKHSYRHLIAQDFNSIAITGPN